MTHFFHLSSTSHDIYIEQHMSWDCPWLWTECQLNMKFVCEYLQTQFKPTNGCHEISPGNLTYISLLWNIETTPFLCSPTHTSVLFLKLSYSIKFHFNMMLPWLPLSTFDQLGCPPGSLRETCSDTSCCCVVYFWLQLTTANLMLTKPPTITHLTGPLSLPFLNTCYLSLIHQHILRNPPVNIKADNVLPIQIFVIHQPCCKPTLSTCLKSDPTPILHHLVLSLTLWSLHAASNHLSDPPCCWTKNIENQPRIIHFCILPSHQWTESSLCFYIWSNVHATNFFSNREILISYSPLPGYCSPGKLTSHLKLRLVYSKPSK
jgi:hypothetical protein